MIILEDSTHILQEEEVSRTLRSASITADVVSQTVRESSRTETRYLGRESGVGKSSQCCCYQEVFSEASRSWCLDRHHVVGSIDQVTRV